MTGAVQHESREGGGHHNREITNEVLETRPPSRSLCAGQSLCNGPNIGTKNAKENYAQYERGYAIERSAYSREPNENPRERQTSPRNRLTHARGRRSPHDPAIGKPTRQRRRTCSQQVSDSTDLRHVGHGKLSLAHQIKRKPGNEEIAEVITGKEADARSPGRSQPQELGKTWCARSVCRNRAPVLGHPPEPGKQPKQRHQASHIEKRAS